MIKRQIIVIAHDIRSTHNVGSLLRTAEGFGITEVIFSGYTPYPITNPDDRLPHIAQKLTKQIQKTSLGAEAMIAWRHEPDLLAVLTQLKAAGYRLIGLEQANTSVALPDFRPPKKLAILLGREVEGIALDYLTHCDQLVEIPMFGRKESFNVVQATAIMLYHCRTADHHKHYGII
jgi:23S rRNA (guanosine2251-2'-O)-methyltransferase